MSETRYVRCFIGRTEFGFLNVDDVNVFCLGNVCKFEDFVVYAICVELKDG